MNAETRTLLALAVTFLFMLVEAVGGWWSGSLALLADAAHMLADVLALGLTWAAFRVGRMGADGKRSYGYRRFEVLAALFNGLTVVGLSIGICWEAVLRLAHPEAVQSKTMMVVAVLGLLANIVTFKVLDHGHGHEGHDHGHDLNTHGAILHVLGDLLGSVAAIGAALVIMLTGWLPIDPILSMAMALLIVSGGLRLMGKAGHILLEGAPDGFDPEAVAQTLTAEVSGLLAVHHIHAWSVSSGLPMLTLHAVVAPDIDRDAALVAIKALLKSRFHVAHSTVQMEGEGCGDEGGACG